MSLVFSVNGISLYSRLVAHARSTSGLRRKDTVTHANVSLSRRRRIGLETGVLDILVVEDDVILGCLIRDTVVEAGHRVNVVQTVKAARDHIASKPCDAVLLDLNLNGERGEDLIAMLREAHVDVPPVVILSAQGEDAIAEAAAEIGAVATIEKPCTVKAITDAVATLSTRAG
jgi:DNA-binding response OmpR family regulator